MRVELFGDYSFNTAAQSEATYPVSIDRRSTSHSGLDTLDRCLTVRGPPSNSGSLALILRDGTVYRFVNRLSLVLINSFIVERHKALSYLGHFNGSSSFIIHHKDLIKALFISQLNSPHI